MKNKRAPVKANKDRRIFKSISRKTKRVNVRPGEWRGGIML